MTDRRGSLAGGALGRLQGDRPAGITAPIHKHWTEVDAEKDPETYRQLSLDDTDDLDGYTRTSDGTTSPSSGCTRKRVQAFITSRSFQGVVAILITANAVILGLETDNPVGNEQSWEVTENCLLLCFTLELSLRVGAFGALSFFSIHGHDFVWNAFDACLVSLGIFDFICDDVLRWGTGASGVATVFRIFRLLRILRIFRLIRFLKQLYILTYGFALASLAIFWVTILMTAALYICAIILVRTYGHLPKEDPDEEFFQEHYGDILTALFTLFQLMMQPNLLEYKNMMVQKPVLAIFLIVFVIFGSFGMIALLTGVITEAMFEKNVLRLQEEQLERESSRRYVSNMCATLFSEIRTDQFGEASRAELQQHLARVQAMLQHLNVHYSKSDLLHMLDVMDTDGSGAINKTEFCRGLLHIAERSEDLQPMLMMELQQDAITFVKRKVERLEANVSKVEQTQSEILSAVQKLIQAKERQPELGHENRDSGGSGTPGRVEEEDSLGLGPAVRPSAEAFKGDAPAAAREPRAHQREAPAALVEELKGLILRVERNTSALQGDIFSMGARLEEMVSDARSEQIASQLGELAVRRRCMEFESAVASRISACETASRQAKTSAEEVCGQVGALSRQVQALAEGLQRPGTT